VRSKAVVVGFTDGNIVGDDVGSFEGLSEGTADGEGVGCFEGLSVGSDVEEEVLQCHSMDPVFAESSGHECHWESSGVQ